MTYLRWLPTQVYRNSAVCGNEEDAFVPDFRPAVDVEEDKKQYRLYLELPGLEKKDVNLNVKENVLTVSGEKKYTGDSEKNRLHRNERNFGKFQRCFKVPDDVDVNKISADFNQGVLTITLVKSEEKLPKEYQISIN